ncbi:MAG: DUF1643 domain-containing protein [Acidobacteriales bacterium]|nr:DUF1643 domain-containing protein [Terriglobales bacterium]
MPDLFTSTGATFSPCRKYRYTLWRQWGAAPCCMFLMLNPSTADEIANDPTVERCERRARDWGYGGLMVCNIFAYRATDPRDMKAADDPIGPENDVAILDSAKRAGIVVCAWGNHGAHRNRDVDVRQMLRLERIKLHYLKLAKTGQPCHPLYLPYTLSPIPWEGQ